MDTHVIEFKLQKTPQTHITITELLFIELQILISPVAHTRPMAIRDALICHQKCKAHLLILAKIASRWTSNTDIFTKGVYFKFTFKNESGVVFISFGINKTRIDGIAWLIEKIPTLALKQFMTCRCRDFLTDLCSVQ